MKNALSEAANDEYFLYVKRSSFFSALSKNLPSALQISLPSRSHNYRRYAAFYRSMSVGEILSAHLILSVLSEPLDTVCFVKSSYLAAKADIDVYLEHEKESQEPSGYEKLLNSSLEPAIKTGENTLATLFISPELFHTQALSIHKDLVW